MKIKRTNVLLYKRKKLIINLMRTFIFLFCTTIFAITPGDVFSQNAKIVIESDRIVSVDEVFDIIKKQTDYNFIYQEDLFKNAPKVHLKKGIINANELLNVSLRKGNFNFSFTNKNTIVIKVEPAVIEQEEMPITGKVFDQNGLPIPGITLFITDKKTFVRNKSIDFTTSSTTTDADGNFKLRATVGYYLVATGIGFEKYGTAVTAGKTQYSIMLVQNVSELDDVVIVGYGTTKKKDLTGSVGSIDARRIEQIKSQTIDQALVGQISGVYVSSVGGAPGSGATINIRGLNALQGDNQPLYVVDGVPIIVNPVGLADFGQRQNPLLQINPADVESVNVLKDASSAAIYGSRASHGVILITTKRGKFNQPTRFNFSMNTTFQNPTKKWDYMNASEYIVFQKSNAQSILNSYPEIYWEYFPTEYAMVNNPNYFGKADTNWQDLITNKNALWTQYNISVSGGTEKVNFLISGSAADQQGVMIGNKFKRYNFSTSLDAIVTNRIKVGASVNFNYSIDKKSGITDLSIGSMRPDIAPYNADGTLTTVKSTYGNVVFNPLGDKGKIRNTGISQNIYGSIYGEYRLIDNLKFKSQVNVSLSNTKSSIFSPSYTTFPVLSAQGGRPGATLNNLASSGVTTSFVNTLNYIKTINEKHKIDAVAGVSWDRTRLDSEFQNYRGFPDDNLLIDIRSASFVDGYSSQSIESGLNSVFGRMNYIYDDRYLATFTARSDGSTKFGPNNRRGLFPSGALAWNMHNENFLKDYKTINQLKLRASLGRTGSDNLPDFSYLPYYKTLGNTLSSYNGVNGIVVSGVPNNDIKWETTDQLDLGLEFGLFDYRLNGEIVYFKKLTTGLILLVPIAAETGTSSYSANIADVSNKGWEITLGGDVIRNNHFRWNSSFNVSFIKNNIDAMNGGSILPNGTSYGIVQGQPIGVAIGYDVVKIAQTQAEIDALNTSAGGKYQINLRAPGDYIFRDVNGDGKITALDLKPLGSINPKFYGGWNNRVTYDNWDLTFNLDFVEGVQKVYGEIKNLYYVSPINNATTILKDTWTPDNPNAKYARAGSGTHGETPTSKSMVPSSYIRLRSASIGYTLPKIWFKNTAVSNAKISLSGNNLITITKYPGLDPENVNRPTGGSSVGLITDEGNAYPMTRTFTIGFNLSF
jgi:TonB-linked SusC/RagA family outer membrane protein